MESLEDRSQPSFLAPVSYATGTYPRDVVTADFNGDGKLDLAVANNSSSSVSVLLGNPDGTFQPARNFDTGAGSSPASVAVGDFNEDGKLDIVTTQYDLTATSADNQVSVFLGNGDGTFQAARNIALPDETPPGVLSPLPQQSLSVAAGDLNRDGKLDLVVTGFTNYTFAGYYSSYPTESPYVNVLVGNGDGTFAVASSTPLLDDAQPWSLALADFNGDGRLDVVTTLPSAIPGEAAYLSVELGNGDGTLQDPTYIVAGPWNVSVAVADLNLDNKLDLVTASSDHVHVLLGNGDGTFQSPQDFATGPNNEFVAVADFNGDGKPDLVTANFDSTVSVLLGNGDGTLQGPTHFAAGAWNMSAAVGDFNGDQFPDLAVDSSIDVSVLLNDQSWPPAGAPLVSINDVSVTEGNTGTASATFTVSLSAASDQPVTVHYVAADNTATAGSDYAAASGDLTFAPGQTTQTIVVAVLGDRLGESDETFLVNLNCTSNNAVVVDSQGYGTIRDDEPRISLNDVSATEGNTGTVSATFTLSLSAAYDQPVTVHYATADGTATAVSDYIAASGDVTFAPGQTTRGITVAVLGDRLPEADETYLVNLSSPSNNALIIDRQGDGTIRDDEPRIAINNNNVTVREGNTGTTNAPLTVSLSAAYDQPVTVHYATADFTATAGSDYIAASGDVTFAPGQTTRTITVAVLGDRVAEADEIFVVNLSSPSGNALIVKSQQNEYIHDDEPRISITRFVQHQEGSRGSKLFVFTVSLSAAYDQPVTVHYATADGTATAADNDYQSQSGTLTFAPGQTTKTITIVVYGDKKREGNEDFYVNLSSPSSNALVYNGEGIGVIYNDD